MTFTEKEHKVVSLCPIFMAQFGIILGRRFSQLKDFLRPDSRRIFQLVTANIYSVSSVSGEFYVRFFSLAIKLVVVDSTLFHKGESISCTLTKSKSIIFGLDAVDSSM
jgi:hypothetical protein